ncbi:hypothetical protein Dimus_005008 [Dionaea muscipula]
MAAPPSPLVLLFLVLGVAAGPSSNLGVEAAAAATLSSSHPKQTCGYWCICKEGLSNAVLQKTIDYACGAGADCNPIKPKGACFNPNTVKDHCSYAVNSYFQKKGEVGGTCDFAGTAAVIGSDPSYPGCIYPASASASTSSNTPTTVPTSTTVSPYTNGTTATGANPSSTGPLVGFGTGSGPSGIGMNDESDAVIRIQPSILGSRIIGFMTFILLLLRLS